MGIVFSCEHCCNFSNGFDCDTCTNQDKFSNVAKPNLNAVLADGCVAMDERRYLSMIADIRDRWMNGSKPEITAMEWMAKEIYNKFIVTEKKATVS